MSVPEWPSPVRLGREEASALVWRDTPAEAPRTGERRRRGAIRGAIGLGVGGALFAGTGHTLSLGVVAVAGTVLAVALTSPDGAYARLESLLDRLAAAVGKVTTLVVMVPIFYLVFLPFRALFRRGRRDALARWVDPSATTYWEPHGPASDPERLF